MSDKQKNTDYAIVSVDVIKGANEVRVTYDWQAEGFSAIKGEINKYESLQGQNVTHRIITISDDDAMQLIGIARKAETIAPSVYAKGRKDILDDQKPLLKESRGAGLVHTLNSSDDLRQK